MQGQRKQKKKKKKKNYAQYQGKNLYFYKDLNQLEDGWNKYFENTQNMNVGELKKHLEKKSITTNQMRDFQLVKGTTRGSSPKRIEMISRLSEWFVSNR